MKIQCDVCGKEAAAVFCSADEAALCQNCDNRVHNANKLASKHPRFSLLNPQIKESPLCDICQERQALLFCQEDRALLCRDCDVPIHKANELTKKHNRFLLTGVKLSAAAASYQATTSSSEVRNQSNSNANCSETSSNPVRDNESSLPVGEIASESTSSIPEYLMASLPGWHEDFFDPSSHYGFCKIDYHAYSPICLLLHQLKFKNPNEVERTWDKRWFCYPGGQISISQHIEMILVNNDLTSYSLFICYFLSHLYSLSPLLLRNIVGHLMTSTTFFYFLVCKLIFKRIDLFNENPFVPTGV